MTIAPIALPPLDQGSREHAFRFFFQSETPFLEPCFAYCFRQFRGFLESKRVSKPHPPKGTPGLPRSAVPAIL